MPARQAVRGTDADELPKPAPVAMNAGAMRLAD